MDVVTISSDEASTDNLPSSSTEFIDDSSSLTSVEVVGTPNSWKRPSPKRRRTKRVRRPPCNECRQRHDEVQTRAEPHPDFEPEAKVILHPRLEVKNTDQERPVLHITGFEVFDKMGHLVQLASGLIERGRDIFISGFVKPVFDSDPDSGVGGIGVDLAGPIQEWWVTGFREEEQDAVGVSTRKADYYLRKPSQNYRSYMLDLKTKIMLTKLVMSSVDRAFRERRDMTYEELLEALHEKAPHAGLNFFNEEELLRHTDFIVEQIVSYEAAGDEDEEATIMFASCIRDLIENAGLTVPARRKQRNRRRNIVKPRGSVSKCPSTATQATTTTPLIRDIFELSFKKQIAQTKKRTRSCGVCSKCLVEDCRKCSACKRMVKYGGNGSACGSQLICYEKICDNITEDVLFVDEVAESAKAETTKKSWSVVEPGDVLREAGGMSFYASCHLNDVEYKIGDHVLIRPEADGAAYHACRLLTLFREKRSSEKLIAHVSFYARGCDTVLGETSENKELFSLDKCEDVQLDRLARKLKVSYVPSPPPDEWRAKGGTVAALQQWQTAGTDAFFYRMRYDILTGSFKSVENDKQRDKNLLKNSAEGTCYLCGKKKERLAESMPKTDRADLLNPSVPSGELGRSYGAFTYKGEKFSVGDAALLFPIAYASPRNTLKDVVAQLPPKKKRIYTEHFRHKNGKCSKGSNEKTPDPLRICVIEAIWRRRGKEDVLLQVRKLYRPEEADISQRFALASDLNRVLWTSERATVNANLVTSKCHLVPLALLDGKEKEWCEGGRNRFYISDFYSIQDKAVQALPGEVLNKYRDRSRFTDGALPTFSRQPLRTLDVFAGCGGLSEGLEQSGVSRCEWAIEFFEPAAEAFKLNHPSATVLTQDCNDVLKDVIAGRTKSRNGDKLPAKGEVELLVGGPPCQGFSLMNSFSEREYSQFKNSSVASYLSYCDFYRPDFFVFENVRNFTAFQKSLVLKLTLRSLVKMGYQCGFGVLQAGHFGVPQTRHRVFILAAAPDQKLPKFPEARHVFAKEDLSVFVDERKFRSAKPSSETAALRTITVRDAISDLPFIGNGASKEKLKYLKDPVSHYQRLMRRDAVLRDHICRLMPPLFEKRIEHIVAPGCDWRDLPNIVEKLSDGTKTKKLRYRYKLEDGTPGVCICQTGNHACLPEDKQKNTLIPWSLAHTASRNNQWAGNFGRIHWDGFFCTVVTVPEPTRKQGRVIHPQQHRVVSVRECARAQGFRDSYCFAGSLADKHKEIGNAVPPCLAKAIGQEIGQALAAKEKVVPSMTRSPGL